MNYNNFIRILVLRILKQSSRYSSICCRGIPVTYLFIPFLFLRNRKKKIIMGLGKINKIN